MSDQPIEEIEIVVDEIDEKPVRRAKKKVAPSQDLGLSPQTIRARAIVLGRLKNR